MNQGKIWCVVSPTVGLPLFIGSVALTSLAVHYSILSHTTWMSSFFMGAAKGKAALEGAVSPVAANPSTALPAFVISVAPVAGTPGKTDASYVITVTPNSATTAAAEQTSDGSAVGAIALAGAEAK